MLQPQAFAQTAAAEPYDILFIAVDDLNDWVGYLGGHPQTMTPNIDRLAARGLAFTNAHSPSAICNASRTALMTGLTPATTGMYGNAPDWRLEDAFRNVTTLPRHFRNNGYRTLGAGKLFHAHTYGNGANEGYNDQAAWDAFYPSLQLQLPSQIKPNSVPANRNPFRSGPDWAALTAEDWATGDGQVTSWVSQQLRAETGSPRFVAAGIYRPHLYWYVPQKYFDMHPLAEVKLPDVIANDLDDVPLVAQTNELSAMDIHTWMLENDKWQEAVQAYLASVSFADAMVGNLLDALDASGRADRTIIVLWGDHGFHLGEKGRWRKSTLWAESTRIPFIIVAPGVTTPGSTTASPVSLMDIYPTLAELAGLATPSYIEARSLLPLLEDPDADWDHPALITYGYNNHAVVSHQYRYIRYADGSEELYDILDDPNEWTNLATQEQYSAIKRELSQSMPRANAANLFQPRPPPAASP
jgi:arylsulfatase A-like enzyme